VSESCCPLLGVFLGGRRGGGETSFPRDCCFISGAAGLPCACGARGCLCHPLVPEADGLEGLPVLSAFSSQPWLQRMVPECQLQGMTVMAARPFWRGLLAPSKGIEPKGAQPHFQQVKIYPVEPPAELGGPAAGRKQTCSPIP